MGAEKMEGIAAADNAEVDNTKGVTN